PHEADHEQIGLESLDPLDDGGGGVPGDDLGFECDALGFCDLACVLKYVVELVVFRFFGLDHFVDRGGKIRQLLHRNHVQRGAMQLGEIAREIQRLAAAFRSIVRDGDPLEHCQTSCLAAPTFGRNHRCAITVGTTALPITAMSRIVYWRWSMMWLVSP